MKAVNCDFDANLDKLTCRRVRFDATKAITLATERL